MKTSAIRQAAAILSLSVTVFAQTATQPLAGTTLPPASAIPISYDRGSAAVYQGLQKLKTRASLLTINAHPDDEDGAMMALEARGKGVDASLFVLTRGDAGQNVMSGDYWDQLGIVRTQELLASSGVEGIHLYMGRFADYGFSKTIEEAHKQWGHDRVLADSVRMVRTLRPMVVTSSFNGNFADGHGHHQVAGEMAQEVFNAAADSNMFPDQIKEGLLPWKVQKVYGRVPFARVTDKGIYDYATTRWEPVLFHDYVHNTDLKIIPPTTLEAQSGDYSSVLANTYTGIAREGLALQRSQNGGVGPALPGPNGTPYHLWATRATATAPEKEKDFFDGIDTSVPAIADYLPAAQRGPWKAKLQQIAASVSDASTRFDAADPGKIAPALARGLAQTEALIAEIDAAKLPAEAAYNMKHELTVKRDQFRWTLTNALGLSVIAMTGSNRVIGGAGAGAASADSSLTALPGQTINVILHIANQGSQPVAISSGGILISGAKSAAVIQPAKLAANAVIDSAFPVAIPADQPPTKTYFSRPSLEQPYYNVSDNAYLGLPLAPYALIANIDVNYNGVTFPLQGTVQTQHRVLGLGVVFDPLLIAPAISLVVSPQAGIVPMDAKQFTLNVALHSNVKGPAKGEIKLNLPEGWTSSPAKFDFATMRDGDEQSITFQVTPKAVSSKPYTLTAVASYNGKQYESGYVTTGYFALRPYPSYRDATYRTTGVDVKIADKLKVAYVTGTGDEVAQSIGDLGIHPAFLSAQEIAKADLSVYDVIILGIRTYAARPELKTYNNRLLEYVQNGGTLVVQYQNNEFDNNYGPYPLHIEGNGETVAEEDNKVTIVDPKDPILNWPNKITLADFDNWVEERSHGGLATWDDRYSAPVEMHDDKIEEPQRGSLVYARYGKGVYVYAGYAFFRELPEGVPGTFRIMANILSIGKNKELK